MLFALYAQIQAFLCSLLEDWIRAKLWIAGQRGGLARGPRNHLFIGIRLDDLVVQAI